MEQSVIKTDKICIGILAVMFGTGIAFGDVDFWKILSAFLGFIGSVAALYLIIYVATRAYYRAKKRVKDDN